MGPVEEVGLLKMDFLGLRNLDVIEDAIEEALRQRVTVNVVFEPAAKQAIHGLAALLRFR